MASKRVGRPLDPSLEETLLRVAEHIMDTEGFSGLTVDRLAKAASSTRPTFYRRFSGVGEIALVVIERRRRAPLRRSRGSLREDLLQIQRAAGAMLARPSVQQSLPGLVQPGVVRERGLLAVFVHPTEEALQVALDAARERGELVNEYADRALIRDILLGPLIARTLIPTPLGIEEDFLVSTVDAALETIRGSHGDDS